MKGEGEKLATKPIGGSKLVFGKKLILLTNCLAIFINLTITLYSQYTLNQGFQRCKKEILRQSSGIFIKTL